MHTLIAAFWSVWALFIFAWCVERRQEANNWNRLAFGLMGVGAGVSSLGAFSSVGTASPLEMFQFLAQLMGAAGGALSLVSIRRDAGWRVRGLGEDVRGPAQ